MRRHSRRPQRPDKLRGVRTLLIVNPKATSTTAATRDLLAHALESRTRLTVALTRHCGHARELAAQAAADQMDLIVVHGGDGTVNETINGFLPVPGPANTAAPVPRLGVIPGGSGNVFARALGIAADPVAATNQLVDLLTFDAQGRLPRRRIGLGIAENRWFCFSAGMGLDAAVCQAVAAARDRGHTPTANRYLRTAVRQFFVARRHPPNITLSIPGHSPVTDRRYVFLSNCDPWTYWNNTPVRPNPGTRFDTGLGVFAVGTLKIGPTARVARQLLTTRAHPASPHVFRLDDTPSVRVSSAFPIGLQIDGDFVGTRGECEFRAAPEVLDVVAPEANSA